MRLRISRRLAILRDFLLLLSEAFLHMDRTLSSPLLRIATEEGPCPLCGDAAINPKRKKN